MTKRVMKQVAVLVATVMLPAGAAAQTVAHSFAELNSLDRVREGDKILITFAYETASRYTETEARLAGLTDSAITVRVDSLPPGHTTLDVRSEGSRHLIEIPESRVKRIELPERGRSRWAGGLIGVGAGLAGVGFAAAACIKANEQGSGCDTDLGLLAVGLVGGGATIGALLASPKGRETVFRADDQVDGSLALSLSPILWKDRKGRPGVVPKSVES